MVARLQRWLRPAAFLLLTVLTAYSAWLFYTGNWGDSLALWQDNALHVAIATLLVASATTIDYACWAWVYTRFGIRSFDALGGAVFLSCHAGQVMPAQTNRLLRPDAMLRLGRSKLRPALYAEAVVLYIDLIGLGGCLVAAVLWVTFPGPLVIGALLVSIVGLALGDRAASLLSHTSFSPPSGFWWSPSMFVAIFLRHLEWLFQGLALYALLIGVTGEIDVAQAALFVTASTFLGTSTGLPGGIGAVEGLLGWFLSTIALPQSHLVIATGLYRIITFWALLPIGWLALYLVHRRSRAHARKQQE